MIATITEQERAIMLNLLKSAVNHSLSYAKTCNGHMKADPINEEIYKRMLKRNNERIKTYEELIDKFSKEDDDWE